MYTDVVIALQKAFEILPKGVDLSKGGLGELALAHELGHTLVAGDKGADASDDEGNLYEYKVSTTNQFNFNFMARRPDYCGVSLSNYKGSLGRTKRRNEHCGQSIRTHRDSPSIPTSTLREH